MIIVTVIIVTIVMIGITIMMVIMKLPYDPRPGFAACAVVP